MAKVKDQDNVKVHYTGKLKDGQVFDTSQGREPLEFKVGEGNMIPGFEKGVMDMELNEEKTIEIPFAEAYGPVNQDLIQKVEKDKLPPDLNPAVGMKLMSTTESGHQIPIKVTEVGDDYIMIDANHELAGKDLVFDVKVVKIN